MVSLPWQFGWPADPLLVALGIFLGAVFSEDLTCITVGLLLGSGQLAWFVGFGACLAGTLVSDSGLWLLGRLGGRWPWQQPAPESPSVE